MSWLSGRLKFSPKHLRRYAGYAALGAGAYAGYGLYTGAGLPGYANTALSLGKRFMGSKFAVPALNFALGRANSAYAYNQSVDAYRNRYQWQMSDMRKAGLNPMLAAQGGMSPGGSPTGYMPNMPDIANTAKAMSEAEKISGIDTIVGIEKATNIAQDTLLKRVQAGVAKQNEKTLFSVMLKNLTELKLMHEQAVKTIYEQGMILDEQKLIRKQAEKLINMMPRLQKEAEVYNDWFGQILTYIKAISDSLGFAIPFGAGYGATKAFRGSKVLRNKRNLRKQFNVK